MVTWQSCVGQRLPGAGDTCGEEPLFAPGAIQGLTLQCVRTLSWVFPLQALPYPLNLPLLK